MSNDLYVGVDIGKRRHAVALLSQSLLSRFHRFQDCPVFFVEQDRAAFEHLYAELTKHAEPAHIHVLMEHTGHYGAAIEQYCYERGISAYRIHPHEHLAKRKTDRRDAQLLALRLYNQIELQMHVAEKHERVHRLVPPSETATLLRGLVQHHIELSRETTRHKNKLVAIADELFPELTHCYKDVNAPSALALRVAFPTPEAVSTAPLDALVATRTYRRPGRKALANLQELARHTIGTKNVQRIKSLVFEQSQLIKELKLLEEHVDALEKEITPIVQASRDGQIYTSFTGCGPIHAATLIAFTGSIANFASEGDFRSFCGWSPHEFQTGETADYSTLKKGGHSQLKRTVFLITTVAIKQNTRFRQLYERLVPRMCPYNERLGDYTHKMKPLGRVAGQMLGVMYTLLKKDHDILASLKEGDEIPAPVLYDPAKHHLGSGKRVQHSNLTTPPVEQADG